MSTPSENILYDEVLLHSAEKKNGGEVLRFWESPVYFIVLGMIGRVDEDLKLDAIKDDRISVLRRSSGGGTVLQGPGCLNFSLILSKEQHPQIQDLHQSYHFILSQIVAALKECHIDAQYLPISDIALSDSKKKISGNAQKRSRNYILHHGTLLYNFDLELIAKYQKIPKSMPDYRRERSHLDFVSNAEISPDDFKRILIQMFACHNSCTDISKQEHEDLKNLIQTRKVVIDT